MTASYETCIQSYAASEHPDQPGSKFFPFRVVHIFERLQIPERQFLVCKPYPICKSTANSLPIYALRSKPGTLVNSVVPDQMQQNAISDKGLHYLYEIQEFVYKWSNKNKPDTAYKTGNELARRVDEEEFGALWCSQYRELAS